MLFVKDFVARFGVKSNSFSFPLFQISCSRLDNLDQWGISSKVNVLIFSTMHFKQRFRAEFSFYDLNNKETSFSFGCFVTFRNKKKTQCVFQRPWCAVLYLMSENVSSAVTNLLKTIIKALIDRGQTFVRLVNLVVAVFQTPNAL